MAAPIVFWSPLSDRFFVTRAYRHVTPANDPPYFEVTGQKHDVTESVLEAIRQREQFQKS